MKIAALIIIGLFLCFTSCENNKCKDFYNFDYDYKIEEYFKYPNASDSSLMDTEFHKNGLLIALSGREGDFTKYVYDIEGVLRESYWGRQCGFSVRTIYKFDSLNNIIGEVRLPMRDTITNTDSMSFEKVRYYDDKSRLVKKLIYSNVDSIGTQNSQQSFTDPSF